MRKDRMGKDLPGKIFVGVMLLLLYLPILVLAFYSFTTSANIGSVHGFTMDNYINLFSNEELRSMILGTVFLAFGSSFLAAVLGTLGAIGAFYAKKVTKNFVGVMNEVPVINADVVTGFSVCIMLVVVLGIDKSTYVPLVIGHVVLSAPFVYLSVVPRLKQMDASLYEAAMDLGATPRQALIKVVLPQIQPGIVSGFALAVTLSLDLARLGPVLLLQPIAYLCRRQCWKLQQPLNNLLLVPVQRLHPADPLAHFLVLFYRHFPIPLHGLPADVQPPRHLPLAESRLSHLLYLAVHCIPLHSSRPPLGFSPYILPDGCL